MQLATAPRRTYGSLTYVRDARRGQWAVDAVPQLAGKLKRLLPRVSPGRTGTILVVDTPEIAHDLEWITERYPLEMNAETSALLRASAERHREAEAQVFAILNGQRLNSGVRQPARTPYPEQLLTSDLLLTTGSLLCTDDTGLGKSFTALLALRAADALPALVVTMTNLTEQWIARELPLAFPELRGHTIDSTGLYVPMEGGREPDVLAISYSKLAAWADYLAGVVKTVIFDEIQELRHEGTDKYNAAGQIADSATYRFGLSATPVFNYGGEIWNIMDVLKRDCLGSKPEFLREWGKPGGNGRIVVTDPKALGDHLRAEGLMVGHTREDVGRPIPKPRVLVQKVDADPAEYQRLSGNAVDLARFVLNRMNNQSKRWHSAGELERRLRQATGIAKAPFVAAFTRLLLESGTDRLLLWGWHRAVYDIWNDLLSGYHPAMYTGTETAAQKRKAVRRFLDGDSRILIMSLRSGAGLDGLQMGCNTCVFGEIDWSPQVHRQCIGRLGRDGIVVAPEAHFCISDYGSDPAMVEILDIKRMQNDPMVNPRHSSVEAAAASNSNILALAESVLRRAGVEDVA
jgi:hypothetical protein